MNETQKRENKLLELSKNGYDLRVVYYEKEDIIKDIDDGKVDDLLNDSVPKAIDLVLKNKNFIDPGPDGIVETTFIPRSRHPKTKYQRTDYRKSKYGLKERYPDGVWKKRLLKRVRGGKG